MEMFDLGYSTEEAANNGGQVVNSQGTGSGTSGATNTSTVKVIGQNQVIQASGDLTQYMTVQTPGGQTVGIVNADGTVTQINSSVASSSIGNLGNSMKTVTSVAGQSIALPQGTQIVSQNPGSAGGIAYSIIPAQQIQNIQLESGEAIFIPASSLTSGQQAIQISGNQILSSPNQTIVRAQGSSGQNNQQTVIQSVAGVSNVNFTQLTGGQPTLPVAVRQGNVLQTLQLPISNVQQTIPVQVPISTANGQTILQTIHLPIQAIQAVAAGNVQQVTAQVIPQLGQVIIKHN